VVSISTCAVSVNARIDRHGAVEYAKRSISASAGEGYVSAVQDGISSHFSALVRQLSEVASRAEVRDKGISHAELREKAAVIVEQIVGASYSINKAKHDAEIPDTDDPQLLARAKQATRFNHGWARNPFNGMSRDQLALIAYDEGGAFTVNERRAAWIESARQEQEWRKLVVQKAVDEYNSTGKLTNFFAEVLVHYKELPQIEQAQYPEDYEKKLQEWIKLDFNYKTHRAEGADKEENVDNLIEEFLQNSQSSH